MGTLAILFVVVLLINLIPAFAPPTWMAMSWIGFNVREGNAVLFAVVAASAATTGRVVLATFARSLARSRLMRESDRQNIDAFGTWLNGHKRLTVSAFFLYALGPFPSNYLFIAYGLAGLPIRFIAAAFFIGRTASYALWAYIGKFAAAQIDPESEFAGRYLSGYFLITQLALLSLVYILMRLDWNLLIEKRKLTWRRTSGHSDDATHGKTSDR